MWIGSSESNETDSSRLDDLDEDALLKRDGIGVVYIPLAPNEARVPGFDPFVVSTWRREVTAEESQALLDVAEVRRPTSAMAVYLTHAATGELHCQPGEDCQAFARHLDAQEARAGPGGVARPPSPLPSHPAAQRVLTSTGGQTLIHLYCSLFSTRVPVNCVHRRKPRDANCRYKH